MSSIGTIALGPGELMAEQNCSYHGQKANEDEEKAGVQEHPSRMSSRT